MPLRISVLSCYALSVCVAAAVLASCSGTTQLPNPAAQPPLGNTGAVDRSASQSIVGLNRPDSGSGKVERLRAPEIQYGNCGGDGFQNWCYFRARGRAVGPYPGSFLARNKWRESCSPIFGCGGSFTQDFIIRSGATKIVGTIEVDGSPTPGVYQYTTKNGYSGNVKIQSLGGVFGTAEGDFREAFYGM
jgi:hypothetical protein